MLILNLTNCLSWKKMMAYLSILFLASLFILMGCISFRTNDSSVSRKYLKKGLEVRVYHESFEGTSIRWIETGLEEAEAPILLFVHGAPGSSNAYDKYLQDNDLIVKARLISIDRLGYGYSDYGHATTSIARQAKQVAFVSQQYPQSKKIILIGHSFGGPIVSKTMMDYPSLATAGILLAPAVDPDHEKILWVANFTKWKATRWLFSAAIKVSSDEKFSHIHELQQMDSQWHKIIRPIIHIHGTKDNIVPYPNLNYVKSKLPDSLLTAITWQGANHLIIWNKYKEVKKIILSTLEKD